MINQKLKVMSEAVLQHFNSIDEKVRSEQIGIEEAAAQIENLDFNSLSFDEIQVVEDADWIPDRLYVKIMRSWMKNQERNMNHIISYLTMTNSVGKDQMVSFVDAVFKPQNALSLEIDNIFEKIATGGGNREYTSPVSLGLIKVESPVDFPAEAFKLHNIFSGNPTKFFKSIAKPKASFMIELPPYMKVILKSYKIRSPPQFKGPKSWIIQAQNEQGVWIDIATEKNTTELNAQNSEATFQVTSTSDVAYSSFQFINLELTHDNSYALTISSFDISGIVILKSNRKY